MCNLKKLMCLILAAAMIIVATPVDSYAGEAMEGEIDLVDTDYEIASEEIISDDENAVMEEIVMNENDLSEDITIEDTFGEDIAEEELTEEVLMEEEIPEELLAEDILDEEETDDTLDILGEEVAGVNYEEGAVYALVDTGEEAEEMADFYGITLESYDYSVAYYKLPKGISVAEIIKKSMDNEKGYPVLCANHYGTVSDCNLESNDIGYGEEEGIDDDLELESYLTDTPLLEKENLLNENVMFSYGRPYGYQWQHDVIGSPYAWTSGIRGRGIKVAILSTGIYHNARGYDNYIIPIESRDKIIGSYYAPGDSTTASDAYETAPSNGTFLAELIGEEIDSTGADPCSGVGVAPECSFYNIKITKPDDTKVEEVDLIKAIKYAAGTDADIMVIDACFSYPMSKSYNDGAVNLSIKKVLEFAHSKGIAVFARAARASDQSEVWPAAYPNVIAVTATDKDNRHLSGSGYSTNTDLAAPGDKVTTAYFRGSGTLAAVGIAAGEAALILSQKSSIKALQNEYGSPLTGSALVDALEKHMKASTISAGKECGAGIVYLPKALGLGTITTTPAAPTIVPNHELYYGDEDLRYQFGIEDRDYGVKVYYTTNGKNPTYKNGAIDSNSKEYNLANSYIEEAIDISQKNFVIKAIAVDEKHGLVSPVATKTITLNCLYKVIVSAPTNQLVRGKTLKCTAKLVPNNSYTSGVIWKVVDGYGREQPAKDAKVTVNSSGVVSAKKGTGLGTGTYYVRAISKKNDTISSEMAINVVDALPFKSMYIEKGYGTRTAYLPVDPSADKNLLRQVMVKNTDGHSIFEASIVPDDFIVTSSNTNVVAIERDGANWVRKITGPGKATITITDARSMGLKTSYTINVIQNATGVNIKGGSYVVAGKSLTLSASPFLQMLL